MARPRPRPRRYNINPKVCAMATFPYGGTSCQRARAGTPDLWQKRTTSVVTSRQDGNELTLITVFARIIRIFFVAVSVHLCVIENITRPRPRTRTWKCVLKDPRGQGHVLEDSITANCVYQSAAFCQLNYLMILSRNGFKATFIGPWMKNIVRHRSNSTPYIIPCPNAWRLGRGVTSVTWTVTCQ